MEFDITITLIKHILATVGLFSGIKWTIINIARMINREFIPSGNFIWTAIGWTIFISAMWIF